MLKYNQNSITQHLLEKLKYSRKPLNFSWLKLEYWGILHWVVVSLFHLTKYIMWYWDFLVACTENIDFFMRKFIRRCTNTLDNQYYHINLKNILVLLLIPGNLLKCILFINYRTYLNCTCRLVSRWYIRLFKRPNNADERE